MLLVVVACVVGEEVLKVHFDADNYEYWCVGNCKQQQDIVTSTIPGLALSGETCQQTENMQGNFTIKSEEKLTLRESENRMCI